MRVDVTKRALAHIQEIVSWYETNRPEALDALRIELKAQFETLGSFPYCGIRHASKYRRMALRRFPFAVLYEVRTTSVLIVGVVHLKRGPSTESEVLEG